MADATLWAIAFGLVALSGFAIAVTLKDWWLGE